MLFISKRRLLSKCNGLKCVSNRAEEFFNFNVKDAIIYLMLLLQ